MFSWGLKAGWQHEFLDERSLEKSLQEVFTDMFSTWYNQSLVFWFAVSACQLYV